MNKKKGIKMHVIAAIAAFMGVGFIGCIDDEKNFQKEEGKSGVPSEFDFSTKKDVDINLEYKDLPVGYQVAFEMYTKSPLTLDNNKSYVKDYTLTPFLSGRTDENGKVSFKGVLPATVNEIYVYSTGIGVPVLMKASVSNEGVVSKFEPTEVKKASSTRANNTSSGTTSWTTYNVTLNKPELPKAERKTITEEIQNLIDKSFPENQEYNIRETYYMPSIELKEDARVKIYSVENGKTSERTNALAYFVYTQDDKVVKPADVNSNLNLVFPELTKTTPAKGEGYKLLNEGSETFKAGSHIGFALFPDITPGNIKTKDAKVLYSCYNTGSWNIYSFVGENRAAVPHMVLSLLKKDENGHAIIAIAFEDQPWSGASVINKGNFRDDIFILEIDPASSLPENLPTPPTSEPVYEYVFSTSGILCFEDSWPTNGDYDINDVTVSYLDTIFFSKTYSPVMSRSKYTFMHNGADYRNGFGYQLMGVQESDIKECKITSSRPNNLHSLDAAANEVSVILFENGKNVVPGTTFNVSITFNPKNILYQYNNPFIIVRGGKYGAHDNILTQGRTEVHLATPKASKNKYLPTSKANNNYWGKENDKSIPASKIYYVRESNYPFALDINWEHSDPANFVIPKEGESIDKTYSKFTKWVTSGGKENTDWYLHPNK